MHRRNPRGSRHLFSMAIAALTFASLSFGSANAMKIQNVTSKSGLQAWLVEDHTRPILSIQFAFAGGSAQDPEDKSGLATFVTGMLDEGAGDLDSQAYQTRLEELAAKINFSASQDHVTGSFQSLTANRAESMKLLKLALNAPRFTPEDVERIREQIVANILQDDKDPDKIAMRKWFQLAFGSHPYSRDTNGTLKTAAAITPDDLRSYVKKNFARDNLKIAVVGDIDPASLSALMDDVFGGLPAKSDRVAVADVVWPKGVRQQIDVMPNPQSVVQFGFEGLKRKDPDFVAAFALNYVIGGGGFSSKLMQEVREKRGLAYSVYTYLYPLKNAGLFVGGVATENKSVKQSLDVIKSEFEKVAAEGITDKELQEAKDYLTGSYALRFDTSVKIAGQLLAIQLDDLGLDYIDRRNGEIDALKQDDIKRTAKRLLETQNLLVMVVGEPEGLTQTGL